MDTREHPRPTADILGLQDGPTRDRESRIGRAWRAWRAAPLGVRLTVGLSLSASATALTWLVMSCLYLVVATAAIS